MRLFAVHITDEEEEMITQIALFRVVFLSAASQQTTPDEDETVSPSHRPPLEPENDRSIEEVGTSNREFLFFFTWHLAKESSMGNVINCKLFGEALLDGGGQISSSNCYLPPFTP